MNVLLLGSSSQSRQRLLSEANIPFVMIGHTADETACDWGLPLQKLVESIALSKMEHVVLPQGEEGQQCFVLTADTLSQDIYGNITGKPIDREDARQKIKDSRGRTYTGTAFCLDKRIYRAGAWQVEHRIVRFVGAHCQFIVPDNWVENYLENSLGMQASGAIAIEEYGGLFLKEVQGSYTTIVGLPLFELREALSEVGFFAQ